MLRLFTFLFLFTISPLVFASYDKDIEVLYQHHPASSYQEITDRITDYSQYFLAKPYKVHPIGEGSISEFEKKPLYRTDAFDCFSYVTLILSLVEANNLAEFQQKYRLINYVDGKVAYANRYHFTNDWNKANAKNGYLTDITKRIVDINGKQVFKISTTQIDKPGWFKKLPLAGQRNLSKQFQPETSVIAYLPLSALFAKNGRANTYLFKQIPSGSIIEIVRANWDLTKTIGTHLDVSHVGFAIRNSQGLMFRAASDSKDWGAGVIDVPLVAYLRNCLKVPSISGINIQNIKG